MLLNTKIYFFTFLTIMVAEAVPLSNDNLLSESVSGMSALKFALVRT